MKAIHVTLATLAVGALLFAAPSCSDKDEIDPVENPTQNYEPVDESTIAKATIAKKVVPEYASWAENFDKFTSKLETFSGKLASSIGCKKDGNTVISPLSTFTALGMAADCANGETRQELLDALGITHDELLANIEYLCYTCNWVFDNKDAPATSNLIRCANSLWVRNGVPVKDNGVKSLTTNFLSDVMSMDFDNTDVNSLVTSYIKNETYGFLSPDMDVKENAAILLMSVVYLRDVWNELGNDLDFTEAAYDFHNSDKSTKNTKLLQGNYYGGKAIETKKFRKFYTRSAHGLYLTFIVPNEGYTVDDLYTADVLNDTIHYTWNDDKYRYHTRCLFPEFKADFNMDVKDCIKNLGVNTFFSPFECDFSNLTEDAVYCSKIQHVAKLEVARHGIEGAAVTEVEMMKSSADIEPEDLEDLYQDFIIDRDFIYTIEYQDIPVFTGVVKTIK
jgi:serpin B